MKRIAFLITFGFILGSPVASLDSAKDKLAPLGDRALSRTKSIIAKGPRPSGSKTLFGIQEDVRAVLSGQGYQIKIDAFEATTPIGKVPMRNVIGILPGTSSKILMLACHIESKKMDNIRFVGANDAASACALILEMAGTIKRLGLKKTVWLVFFDGEEAFKTWSRADSLYGSRHLAGELKTNGLLTSIEAMVLLDMIGDKDLQVAAEAKTPLWLQRLAELTAKETNTKPYMFNYKVSIEDDHLPFAELGVPVIDLIDFRYGKPTGHGAGSYFHTAEDTIDKVSAKSLDIVGHFVLKLLTNLDKRVGE